MAENAKIRLNKVLRELNISLDRAVDYLASQGHTVEARPTTKISNEVYQVLQDEFQTDMSKKVASKEVGEEKRKEKEAIRVQLEQEQEDKRLQREKRAAATSERVIKAKAAELAGPKTVGKIDLDAPKKAAAKPVEEEKAVSPSEKPAVEKSTETAKAKTDTVKDAGDVQAEPEKLTTQYQKLSGPKIMGDKIDLAKFEKPKKKKEDAKSSDGPGKDRKKRRKRIISSTGGAGSDRGRPRGGYRSMDLRRWSLH